MLIKIMWSNMERLREETEIKERQVGAAVQLSGQDVHAGITPTHRAGGL